MVHKTRFINSCDAMLHARLQGESFGLACGEFSIRNKPVITYAGSKHRHHIDVLGDSGFYYTDADSLVKIIEKLDTQDLKRHRWDRYSALYNREVVMGLFDQHLIQPALRNPDLARPPLDLGWADRLRCTRVLGPPAVALHCLLGKGLIFDGKAGLLYTAQRITADLILSMHLLRRDLDRLVPGKTSR